MVFDTFGFSGKHGSALSGSAIISECWLYRYYLTRELSHPEGIASALVFCMLNPSTADASVDDNTIRKCMGYARREGKNLLIVVNLYGFRSKSPADLKKVIDPFGPDNALQLLRVSAEHSDIVCAWGKPAPRAVAESAARLLRSNGAKLLCLGTNLDGSPKHPLYIKKSAPLIPWTGYRDEAQAA